MVAAYLQFAAWDSVTPDQVRDLFRNRETGLFHKFPEVSGFLHFVDGGMPIMRYDQNDDALRPIEMPHGLLYA